MQENAWRLGLRPDPPVDLTAPYLVGRGWLPVPRTPLLLSLRPRLSHPLIFRPLLS